MSTIKQNLIARFGEKITAELIGQVDIFFQESLKKRSPFSYWVLSKRFFQKGWVMRILGINLKEYHLDTIKRNEFLHYILEVCIRNRVIGRARVRVTKKGKVSVRRII